MQGGGTLTLTGHLGDVMKESARTALSWFRANAQHYGVDPSFYKDSEIHLHVPSGAVPKDGPSAGVTMVCALASELTGRPVRGDIAMTGRNLAVRPRAAGGRYQGEGAGGATARHHRADPAAAEREERQGGSHGGSPQGADDPLRREISEVVAIALQPSAKQTHVPMPINSRRPAGGVNVVYSARYEIPLPGHIWPTTKYRLIAGRLRGNPAVVFLEPSEASWEDLALVHTRGYLAKLRDGTLTPDDIATLELPWVPGMADGFRLMVGGTIAAARSGPRRRVRRASGRWAAPRLRQPW